MSKNTRLVYSTDQGRVKEATAEKAVDSGDGIVRLLRETKGRKGKGVTLITGLGLKEAELKALAKKLKQQCGVGGAIKDGVIEIQTDDREKLKALLEKQGLSVKIAGG
ncbi:stress response translation initiation inhibitor YciH [Aestuariicella hydrocarbonica]|uniref:Stress response translation initiation inhibitor YciH n=1 Tax=Pseudomaricurvus hydrocarbonicus TaxID=1470433 RepID=A0A9E5JPD2_9GAMM|nr:stress response translation initiation inhibitor YciH [Aestuariicella hydrocarbonica]NHO64128.1 stress response translation initiation inhibitor YciH [Aestuariicella hydrocarbonica]